MSLISILLVLGMEQLHVLPAKRLLRAPFLELSEKVMGYFNDGEYRHGVLAWGCLAALPSICVLLVSIVLLLNYPFWAFILSLSVLCLTLGLRHFSHQFTAIQLALQFVEVERARTLLAAWRGCSGDRLSPSEIAGHAIARGLNEAHQHVFAPIFWFTVLGPAGALLYRVSQLLDESWGQTSQIGRGAASDSSFDRFGEFSRLAFFVIDWIPARLTALAFAVVGDFEDAVHCWRSQLGGTLDPNEGIIVASGAGALGVRLTVTGATANTATGNELVIAEFGLGDDPDSNAMQRAAAMVWRALLLVLILLTVILLSSWQMSF